MSTFQERLKQIRDKLTQEQISIKIDTPVVTYGRYERGEVKPDIEFIEKVCRTFNVNANWLIMGEGPMRPGEEVPETQVKLGYIDPAVQIVEESIKETGVQLNELQKRAAVEMIREEMRKRTDNMLKGLKGIKTEE